MRKSLFRCCPLLAALLCLCLCVTARAEEEPLLNGLLRDDKDGVALTCWYDDETAMTNVESALCSVYDGSGRLLRVSALDPKAGRQNVVIPCDTALVDHAKLMTMDADNKPLSPVRTLKPASLTTDTPQFMSGYPVVSENAISVTGSAMVRVKVMADRSCRLYWALYKHSSGGYATRDRFATGDLPKSEKNSMMVLSANQSDLVTLSGLDDQTEYDLDLWLTNTDFTKTSYISRIAFTTIDTTSPVFLTAPAVESAKEHTVTLKYSLNENSTLYWTAVESGAKFPTPPTGGGAISVDYGIEQVQKGLGGLQHGKVNARANASGTFQITGLLSQKSYDVWYVAVDSAGNHTEFRTGKPDSENESVNPRGVCMLTVYTLDNQPPTISVETSLYPEGHPETPYADTNVRLVFNEAIRRFSTGEVLADLYAAVTSAKSDNGRAQAKEILAAFLRDTITLYVDGVPALERLTDKQEDWLIDYRNALVTWENENLVLTFPTTDDANLDSALLLLGGKTYYFLIQDISDLAESPNIIKSQKSDSFSTMPAQILFKELTLKSEAYPSGVTDVDLAFSAEPVAVSRAGSDAAWDLLFWLDATSSFEVYRRSRPSTSVIYDQPWSKMQSPLGTGGQGNVIVLSNADGAKSGQSMHIHLCQYASGAIPSLNALEDGRVYEYAVRFLEVEGDSNRKLWDGEVNLEVTAVTSSASNLLNLATDLTQSKLETAKKSGSVQEINSPNPFTITRLFRSSAAPTFINGAPTFTPGDTSVEMWFQMTRPGTVYYLLAPAGGTVKAMDRNNKLVDSTRYSEVPQSGEDPQAPFTVSQPNWLNIINQRFSGAGVKTGFVEVSDKGASTTVTGLKSETVYFAYFALQGSAPVSGSAQMFRFTTLEAAPPVVQMSLKNPVATLTANQEAKVDYLVVDIGENLLDPLIANVFWNNTPSGGRQPSSSYMQVDNVLQAMCMDTGNGSVFDVYATADYKNKVATYIRESLSDGSSVIGIGKGLRVSATSSLTVDSSLLPMLDGHKYAVITVTQSVDGGPNVFRAVSPVTPPDSIPPLITDITQNLTMDGSESIELNTCSGNVALQFDSDLYYFNAGTLKAVDLGPHYSTLRQNEFTPLIDLGSSAPAGQVSVSTGMPSQVNHNTSVINLTMKNAGDGATITFPTALCDEYGNMHTVGLTVTLRVKSILTGYDSAKNAIYEHRPEIQISSSWDGRAVKE